MCSGCIVFDDHGFEDSVDDTDIENDAVAAAAAADDDDDDDDDVDADADVDDSNGATSADTIDASEIRRAPVEIGS